MKRNARAKDEEFEIDNASRVCEILDTLRLRVLGK